MSRLCQTALLFVVLSLTYGQPSDEHSTVVRVAAWTTAGQRIGKIWVVVASRDGKEKYTATGRDVQLSIPTGEYILQVEAPGFQSKRQILKVYGPSVFRSVALPVARIDGQRASGLTGRVMNYAGNLRSLRVRLVGLYGDEVWEAVLDAQGSFRFPADEGTYLLVTVADLEKGIAVIDCRTVQIKFGEQQAVTVDLKGRRATPVSRPAPP